MADRGISSPVLSLEVTSRATELAMPSSSTLTAIHTVYINSLLHLRRADVVLDRQVESYAIEA